jgi:hypothetical protein
MINDKGINDNMSNMSRKKLLNKKKVQMEARKKALRQKTSQQTDKKPVVAVYPCAEENLYDRDMAAVTKEEDAAVTSEAPPTIASLATNDDVERLLKKIKMEITFADDSTINREIVISGSEGGSAPTEIFKTLHETESGEASKETSPPADTKIPWVTVAVLAFVVCASLVTGIFHWYNAYYLPAEPVEPGHVIANPEGTPDVNTEQGREAEPTAPPQEQEPEPDLDQPGEGRRYAIDPLPEFLVLWDQYNNEDIVAVLTIGETEIPVTQSNNNAFYITHDIYGNLSPQGWVFLDYQVDLYIGMEHNMVIYDPVGEFLRHVVPEYAEYDFFLRNPIITLSTLFGEIEWEIFSYYVAPSDFPFAVVDHPDDDTWGEVVEQFTKASLYNTMLDVNMYDQVLTIAVPTPVNPELFYILQARMLRQITS